MVKDSIKISAQHWYQGRPYCNITIGDDIVTYKGSPIDFIKDMMSLVADEYIDDLLDNDFISKTALLGLRKAGILYSDNEALPVWEGSNVEDRKRLRIIGSTIIRRFIYQFSKWGSTESREYKKSKPKSAQESVQA